MINPFSEKIDPTDNENNLILKALEGDIDSLEKIIHRHQAWIYNIALRMVCNPDDAEDITQEILIKIITKLSSFNCKKSSFRTWLYRIAANHVINMQKKKYELTISSFDDYFDNERFPDERPGSDPSNKILIEELKISCYIGSLLCLDRKHRLTFILGAVFNITDTVGSEILGLSRSNYRQILSRSRKKLFNYFNHNCGLIDKNNPCQCLNKINVHVRDGWLNPKKIFYNNDEVKKIKNVIIKEINDLDNSKNWISWEKIKKDLDLNV